MRVTDYSKIAGTYDQGHRRLDIDPEPALLALLELPHRPVRVLDVGCGTGNWLLAQHRAVGDDDVVLHGVEPSAEMLARAREKVSAATLASGQAESLPYEDGSFELVVSTFAFHHFQDKERAVGEIARVLAPGGVVVIRNVSPQQMPGWWVYEFFPECVAIDAERFWAPTRLFAALQGRGLKPDVRVAVRVRAEGAQALLAEARRRDMSQLAVLEDEAFARGLARMEEALAGAESHVDQIALLTATARRLA